MGESIVLDHASIATNRTALDITNYIAEQGPDFGDAQLQGYQAEGEYGSLPIDGRFPNRMVTIPLGLHGRTGGDSFDAIRTKLQAKVALFQREGGHVARVNTRVGTVYAEVVNATLKLGGSGLQAHGLVDADAALTLECRPDWFGDEVSASPAHSETSLPELKWTETGIEGDYPGRVRLVVTEADGDDQLGLIWGFRSRHYSSASTAALAYEAEALTPMDTAAVASLSGASGGGSNTMQHANLGANWTPVMNTNLLAGTYLTHVGSYRVWARVYSTSGSTVNLRFVYDVGDMTNPTENEAWEFPAASQFYLADLGEIRLDETTGTHRWQGQVQAKGDAGGESVRIDRLYFQPLDESAGRLRAVLSASEGLAGASARDDFTQTAGNLSGKTADVGGNWAGAGDADDYTVNTGTATARRIATSDTANVGRYATISSALSNIAVQADVSLSSTVNAVTGQRYGLLARYVDVSNNLRATIAPPADFITPTGASSDNNAEVAIVKRVAGSNTTLGAAKLPFVWTDLWNFDITLRLFVSATGQWAMWAYRVGAASGDPVVTGYDSVLATGGTLDDGSVGLYDEAQSLPPTRDYDNFAAWVPPKDAVAFANQSVELRTDGMFREDSGGVAYGPVADVIGDNPRVPVAGIEGRTTEAFVLASRGDLDQLPDAGIDDKNAQLFYRASWLYVPDDTGS